MKQPIQTASNLILFGDIKFTLNIYSWAGLGCLGLTGRHILAQGEARCLLIFRGR
jgi:hypothetical protein